MVIEETDVGISWIVGSVPCLPHSVLCSFTLIREFVLPADDDEWGRGAGYTCLGGHAVMHDGLHYYLHLLSDLTISALQVPGQVLWLHLLSC